MPDLKWISVLVILLSTLLASTASDWGEKSRKVHVRTKSLVSAIQLEGRLVIAQTRFSYSSHISGGWKNDKNDKIQCRKLDENEKLNAIIVDKIKVILKLEAVAKQKISQMVRFFNSISVNYEKIL
jgi:hypothetical protein